MKNLEVAQIHWSTAIGIFFLDSTSTKPQRRIAKSFNNQHLPSYSCNNPWHLRNKSLKSPRTKLQNSRGYHRTNIMFHNFVFFVWKFGNSNLITYYISPLRVSFFFLYFLELTRRIWSKNIFQTLRYQFLCRWHNIHHRNKNYHIRSSDLLISNVLFSVGLFM